MYNESTTKQDYAEHLTGSFLAAAEKRRT